MSGRLRHAVIWVVVAILTSVVVILFGLWIRGSDAIRGAELTVLQAFDAGHTPLGDAIALTINLGFGPYGAIVVTLVAAAVMSFVARSWWDGVRTIVLIGVPWGVVEIVKHIVQRPRPDSTQLLDRLVPDPESYSYPSGHTAFATALGLAVVIVLLDHHARRATVVTALAVAVFLALLTAWSRMYLGVHQPTDVTASLVLIPVLAFAVRAVWPRSESSLPAHAHRPA